MTVEGKILEKFDTQEIKESFKKREFVLEFAEHPQYPELLKFELIQSNCEQLDSVELGDEVKVSFNLRGRKWTDAEGQIKYFNSLQAWRIEKKNSGQKEQPSPNTNWMNEDSSQNEDSPQNDDLPF